MQTKVSLRTIVIGGVAAGLLVPMSLGTLYVVKTQEKRLYQEAQAAHARAGNVLALGVSKALWDLSPEAAAPLVDSILEDSRIVSAQVIDAQGNVFHEKRLDERALGEVISLEKPVLNGSEAIGKVKVAFSLASAAAQLQSRMLEATCLALVQALVCIAILVLLINRRLLRPISTLKDQAGLIARKSLDTPFAWQATDEIGELGVSLETTRAALQDLFAELERKNADLAGMNDNLEKLVAERTATIKMILDHVKSGFLLVDRSLTISDGYTRSCESLLDTKDLAGRSLVDALRVHGDKAQYFRACIEQVYDDFLPEEVNLTQVPKRFKIGDHTIALEGSTVRDRQGQVDKILFTLSDITALEKVEAENRSNRSIVRIMQNLATFHDFIKESSSRIIGALSAIKNGNDPIVRRELHTLKGNSAAFGLDAISSLIHQIEDQSLISSENLRTVEKEFSQFLNQNFELFKLRFGEDSERKYAVTNRDLAQLLKAVEALEENDALRQQISRWAADVQKVPVAEVLGPIGEYVGKMARDRNVQVKFNIEGGNLRVDRSKVKDVLQNLIHLIRNAVDHGIEAPEERRGKPAVGSLTVSFSTDPSNLLIRVIDDGRGINAERVLQKALEMRIISAAEAKNLNHDEILNLIFADGLSTADTVNDTSGRGVGMKALKDAVEAKKGSIRIESQEGKGTTFLITIPYVGQMPLKIAA